MKITDYAPRTAVFDTYLKGYDLVGIEIGVDVGAHCEAMLTYCNIQHITLVDIWDKEYYRGYCHGRLAKWVNKISYVKKSAELFEPDTTVDFIYFDLPQTYGLTMKMLQRWYPKLNSGGILGYRGAQWPELLSACKDFSHDCIIHDDDIIIVKP